jgi:probable F420-dependent oxidoreductase
MKVDAALFVQSPSEAGPAARQAEQDGYDGVYTFEGRHDPFLPLAIAAEHTERIELATAVAIAFARNPMILANLGYDLQWQSKGRFILGLGSQIRPHIEKRYSMAWSRPAARMRELVQAIRAIWGAWHRGEKLDFRGEFYTHTLMTPVFNPGPNPYGLPRIFVAGIGPRMTEVVGEVGDGYFVHPLHTERFVRERTLPALDRGLAASGRQRKDFEIACQVILAMGATDEELERARGAAKAHIAFYGSTPAYREVLDIEGRDGLHEELNRLSKQGKWLEMASHIDDDLLERIAVVGTPERVSETLRKRYAHWVSRVSLVSQVPVPHDEWSQILRGLRAS